MAEKISVIIPARNEAMNIEKVIRGALPFCNELIVVDGHSSDETARVAERLGARVVLDHKRGKGDALRTGAEAASGDVLVFIDGDQSHDPSAIPLLLAPILAGDVEHVHGSRMLAGSDELFSSPSEVIRLFGSLVITLLVNARFGVRLTDTQNGFRAIRRATFFDLNTHANITTIEQELVIETLRRGYGLIEIPTHEYRRHGGVSKVDVGKLGFIYVVHLITQLCKVKLKSLPPNLRALQKKYDSTWEVTDAPPASLKKLG